MKPTQPFPNNPLCVLTIDPGKSGGMVFWHRRSTVVRAFNMPADEAAVAELIKSQAAAAWSSSQLVAVVEHVSVMPGQGVASSGKFMRHYGTLRGILAALNVPTLYVVPTKWQRDLGIPPRGDKKKSEHKNLLLARAMKQYPKVNANLKTADALLLLTYAKKFVLKTR